MLFIAATPNSVLKKRLQTEIEKTSFKIRVVEKSGTKLIRLVQRNDPFKKEGCRDKEHCMVCSGSSKKACRETGVTYKINCLGCKDVYTGETGKNGYTRGVKHVDDFMNERETSAMWKHCVEEHNSVPQKFEMVIVDRVRNAPMKRQILEAIRIQEVPQERQMISRDMNRIHYRDGTMK